MISPQALLSVNVNGPKRLGPDNVIGGFTLVELLATIAVAAILAVVAIPSFQSLLAQNRAKALAHSFVTSLNYARSEAIKRGVPVSLCVAATNGTSCDNTSTWSNGWLVFVDPDGSGTVNTSNDVILRTQPAFPAGTTIVAPSTRITYQGNGFIRSGTNMGAGTYNLQPTGCKGDIGGRQVTISSVGHPTTAMLACP